MNLRIFAFDLDSTLAMLGKGIKPKVLELLRKIENSGNVVAICSGKPTYYLCGMLRQVELKSPVLVGENGATIQFGVDLPPARHYRADYPKAADEAIKKLREIIEERVNFPLWFQPNEVCLTPFFTNRAEEQALEEIFAENSELFESILDCYHHCDSFDLVPKGLNKRSGLVRLGEILGVDRSRFVAVGDGENDYPMFKYAHVALGINVKNSELVDRNFAKIEDCLEYILQTIL